MQTNPLDQLVERLKGSAKIERVCGDEMFARELEAAATLIARLEAGLKVALEVLEHVPADGTDFDASVDYAVQVARSTLSPIRRETK